MSSFCFLKKSKNIEIVPLGFSWKAFLFMFVWGFSHKVWKLSLIWCAFFISLIIIFFAKKIELEIVFIFYILSSIFWGFFGSNVLIVNLIEKQFYKPVKIIFSSSEKNALLIYLSENKL